MAILANGRAIEDFNSLYDPADIAKLNQRIAPK
jgi:hypothetical protein